MILPHRVPSREVAAGSRDDTIVQYHGGEPDVLILLGSVSVAALSVRREPTLAIVLLMGAGCADATQNLSPTSRAAMRGVPKITESTPTTAPSPRPPTSYCLFSIFLT